MGELNSAATFLRFDTPWSTKQLKQHGDTLSVTYLPQLMTPQRRHIHGLFVDLQTRTQKLSQNSELFRNTGKGETKRPEIEKWVTNRPYEWNRTWARPLRRFFPTYLLNKLWANFYGLANVCTLHITQKKDKILTKITTKGSNFLWIPPLPGANESHSSCAVGAFCAAWTVTNFPANQRKVLFGWSRITGYSIKPIKFIDLSQQLTFDVGKE